MRNWTFDSELAVVKCWCCWLEARRHVPPGSGIYVLLLGATGISRECQIDGLSGHIWCCIPIKKLSEFALSLFPFVSRRLHWASECVCVVKNIVCAAQGFK